ncbi:MAG: tetratricopeptide repeat protein [Candidatus Eisenbacteria bacterium]|nr:tetratricopeptide repeat protein [Candidatus Eisenbacteria bacterium]
MAPIFPLPAGKPRLDLLILHPAGSDDPRLVSLSIGILQFLRGWLEGRDVTTSFWPETTVDAGGRTRFILRPIAWAEDEIARKRKLVPSARAILFLDIDHSIPATPQARLSLRSQTADRTALTPIPLDEAGVFSGTALTLDELLRAVERVPIEKGPAAIFHTQDHATALATLYALERIVAFQAGIGQEDPQRLFEPALNCLARDPAHPIGRDCLARLAGAATETGKSECQQAARDALQRWSDMTPLSAFPPYLLAMTRMRSGAAEEARASFEESLRRDPLFGPALEQYANWLAERGFVDRGVAMLRSAVGRTDFDGNLLDHAGCLLANAGRLDEADPLFREAASAGGPPTSSTNLTRALLARNRNDEALEVLQRSMARGIHPMQLELMADLAGRSGMAAAGARAILRGRISEGSKDETIQQHLTQICLDLEGPGAAAAQARRLLEIATQVPVRRFAYQVLLRSLIPDFEARWKQAIENTFEGDAESAVSFLREVVTAEDGYGTAHFFLGTALERLGRAKEAVPHLREAIASEGNDPIVLDVLARACAAAGDLEDAARLHHTAASLAPGDARVLHNAAVSLLRAGYSEEGISIAQSSLAIQPEQDDLIDLLKKSLPPSRKKAAKLAEHAGRILRKKKPRS